MAFIHTWNTAFEAEPANSDNASEGALRIRNLKVAISERLEVDHSYAGDAEDGKHKQLTFIEGSAPSTPIAGQAIIYPKAVNDTTGYIAKDDAGLKSSVDRGFQTIGDTIHTITPESGSVLVATPVSARIFTFSTSDWRGGQTVKIYNTAAVALTIKSSDTSILATFKSGWLEFLCIIDTPTSEAHWKIINGGGGGRPRAVVELGGDVAYDFNYAVLAFDSIVLDNNDSYDDSVGYDFTPTIPGSYRVTAQISAQATTSTNTLDITVEKNGAIGTGGRGSVTGSANYMNISAQNIFTLNGTTDNIRVVRDASVSDTGQIKQTYTSVVYELVDYQ